MTDYSNLGLGKDLLKEETQGLVMIDPDIQIEDGAIQGIKLMTKSVSLDKLYGQDLQIGGDSNISGKLIAIDGSGQTRITIDASTGLNIVDNSNNPVLQAIISGANVGDVSLGDYTGNSGLFYDKSAGTFNVKGAFTLGSGSVVSGDYITTGTLNASLCNVTNINATNITTGTLSASRMDVTYVYAGNISASQITSGQITVGGAGHPALITMLQGGSGAGGDAYLRWSGGNQIWADGSSYMGFLAGGERFYFFTGANHLYALFQRGQPASFYAGGAFSGDELKITDNNLYWFDSRLADGHSRYVFKSNDNVERFSITPDASPNTKLSMNGFDLRLTSNKTAVVPTSKGYRALYCMESPEVWFMDFCVGKKKLNTKDTWKFWKWRFDYLAMPDVTFLEVTVPPYIIMPTAARGIIQIWGHRKGHEKRRFEEKTEAEFKKNEEFWSQAKLTQQ